MATRIDIELTSLQDEGRTFTWRAAGARQPKGVADASLFPAGSSVGDEFRVETEMDLDGTRITAVLPPKEKAPKVVQTIELILPDDGPLVTQQLAGGGRRDDRRERRPRRDRDGGGERGERGDRGERGEGRERGPRRDRGAQGEDSRSNRPRTPAKPKLPPKPKPPRLKAGKTHRSALLDGLPEEEKAVAQELLRGGLQAVRQGLATQNEQRKTEGQSVIDEGPILSLAESLLARVRAAEWRDRAEAAIEQAATVDLRDLRSVVTAADGSAKDEETRALAARLRTALNERLDSEHNAWVAEVIEMLDDDRVVRALHLSSRPPKAGAPLPAAVAMRLVEASNASMTNETSADRWIYILDALAHSPVRRQVVPTGLPANVTDDLKAAIARHGSQLPEIAQIFGIEPDPKAGRAEGQARRRRPDRPKKPAGAPKPAEGTATVEPAEGTETVEVADAPPAEEVAPVAAETETVESIVSDDDEADETVLSFEE